MAGRPSWRRKPGTRRPWPCAGDYVEDLAEGTANLINLLRPEAVAFGGGVAGAPETLLLEPLRHRVGELCYSRHGGRSARILRAELGNDAGIIGAALLCRATST